MAPSSQCMDLGDFLLYAMVRLQRSLCLGTLLLRNTSNLILDVFRCENVVLVLIVHVILDTEFRSCRCQWPRDSPPFLWSAHILVFITSPRANE